MRFFALYRSSASYTGVPRETYYEDIPAEPVQDADDL